MRLIDADALSPTLEPLALVEALRAAHRDGGLGEVERLLLEAPGTPNSALVWAAWRPGFGVAVKTATVFPENSLSGLRPNIHSVVTLFDATSGAPLATIHGESFTRMKTAADSALGCDLLAAPDSATLAVIGAGAQAGTHVRYLCAVRPSIRRVLVWNRTAGRAERLAAELSNEGAEAEAVANAQDAVRDAEIVTCLTAATVPVLHGAWLKAGAHVDLVGGFTPSMREGDDELVRRGRLFADTLRFTLETCGDFANPIARGRVEGDLFDLCSGRVHGRRAADEITVFKNGGGGHLDLIIARAIMDLSRASSDLAPNA